VKPVIEAVVGVLADNQGRVLVAQRPADKICPGKWEFPGGKIEDGETPHVALRRELMEELGVDVIDSDRLVKLVNEFPDRCIHLDVWLVRRWRGIAFGVENQAIQWLHPAQVRDLDFLPGSEVILPPSPTHSVTISHM
jgi:8-oxo-dGTP diphosphatase